jgi:hypothetical protein
MSECPGSVSKNDLEVIHNLHDSTIGSRFVDLKNPLISQNLRLHIQEPANMSLVASIPQEYGYV